MQNPFDISRRTFLAGAGAFAGATPGKAEEWTLAALKALTEAGEFGGTFRLGEGGKGRAGAG